MKDEPARPDSAPASPARQAVVMGGLGELERILGGQFLIRVDGTAGPYRLMLSLVEMRAWRAAREQGMALDRRQERSIRVPAIFRPGH